MTLRFLTLSPLQQFHIGIDLGFLQDEDAYLDPEATQELIIWNVYRRFAYGQFWESMNAATEYY